MTTRRFNSRFYLASWGMYRGSGFLLKHDYTIHLAVIDQLVAPQFCVLWEQEFGAGDNDPKLVPIILEAVAAVRQAYRPFGPPRIRHAGDQDSSGHFWLSACM